MVTKLTAADTKLLDEFNFEVAEPPAFAITRTSKHAERWAAAVKFCTAHPGTTIKLISYPNNGSSGNLAKQINNNDRSEFLGHGGVFSAKSARDDIEGNSYSVYLTFTADPADSAGDSAESATEANE
jgi:hypothetical protein